MTHLLSLSDNVIIQCLFPRLDHNDVLQLRQVSKQTKALADAYLWTPQPGHQGKWVLKMDSSKEDQTLEAFLRKGLPPPSRLYLANQTEKGPSEQRSFFEDEHLEEFMDRYSKYITHLRVDNLFFPFTSAKEIAFYESLVNLKKLQCGSITTVGGAAQFEEKTQRAEGSFLIRPTFQNLKIFKLLWTDCMSSMWTFINGFSNNLEELCHPFATIHCSSLTYDHVTHRLMLPSANLAPVQEIIERRGINNQDRLLYNFENLELMTIPRLELRRLFTICRNNGVMMKRLAAVYLHWLLCDENRLADADEGLRLNEGEWRRSIRENCQRNQFLCSVVHSFSLYERSRWLFLLDFPGLEELAFYYHRGRSVPFGSPARNLGDCCPNLKRLIIFGVDWDNRFFAKLWEGLPLLEQITLDYCCKLTNKGFIGHRVDESGPPFLKLKRLKHLTIEGLHEMPYITNKVFRKVFRHLKLNSFKLSGGDGVKPIQNITLAGIKQLLTGSFAETVRKLDLDRLKLQKVSDEEMKKVVTCFRSSKLC